MKRSILIIVFFVAFVGFANAQTYFRGNEPKDFQGKLEIKPTHIDVKGSYFSVYYLITAKKSCRVKVYMLKDKGSFICNNKGYNLLGVLRMDDSVCNYDEMKCLDGGIFGNAKCFMNIYLKKGDETAFCLCYEGSFRKGISDVETIRGLLITAGNKRGYHYVGQSHRDSIRIYHKVKEDSTNLTSEGLIKEKIDENNDGYCGIYEQGYTKYACVKNNEEYSLIYMSGSIYDWWSLGDVKARFTLKDDGEAACTHWIEDRRTLRHAKIQFNEEGMFADNIEYKRIYPTENSDMACRLYARINAKKAIGAAVDKLNDEMYNDALRILIQTTNMDFLDKDYLYYVYMLRAYTYTMMNFYKSAIEDYTKALEYKPEDEDAYYARGMLKLQLQDVTGIDDLKQSGEWGRAILREADLLDYDTSKPLQKEQLPTMEKQPIPQLKKTNR